MHRLRTLALVALAVAPLAGCPIYDDNSTDVPYACDPYSCPNGYCDSNGTCTNYTDTCDSFYCPSGTECRVASGSATCVRVDAGIDSGRPDSGRPDSGTDAGSDGSTFSGCRSDAVCSASVPGAKCLDGVCTPPADQCSDATQCAGGSACVEGVCTPTCGATKTCPTGYACDTAKGVCTNNPTACSATVACTGGTTCVQEHCVTPCGANNTCQGDLVCVDGGCIPDQRPQFVCITQGQRDTCAVGSICLRHSCYIACDPQIADSCKAADAFNQCKSVSAGGSNYSVCGSTSNLGSECDPATSKLCSSGKICIDGFCR